MDRMTNYDTKLTPSQESDFQKWKSIYAPRDSGKDYDLRGAFKSGLTPNPQTGHWPDTFKKPNHPTFSNESIYAKDAPEKAGRWQGNTFIPPQQSGKLNMAIYGEDYNSTRRRNQSYFPSVNFPQAPGVAEGQARMKQIADTSTYKSRRLGGSMVSSPNGGSMFVPFGQQQPYLDKAEIQGRLNAPAQYAQGFGQVSRPVLPDFSGYAPQQQQPLTPSQFASRLPGMAMRAPTQLAQAIGQGIRNSGIGTFAANLGNYYLQQQNTLDNRGMSGVTSPQNQQFYAYNPSPVPQQPRRYFDF